MSTAASKVTAEHLARTAYLYVRQSTLREVIKNTESAEQVVVIDSDQGQSGASAADRQGYQRLVADVAWAAPGSCSAWRSAAWHATRRTGTGCLRSVRCRAR